ncbi:CoA transferase [Cryobacterium sp. TMS1-20-1]|uniref:CaiB/BaiF CoA transferase family protein n=1 Tax=Cryobacterium sp. TMS1-20-1 TaxID=1259223 RepID=UPI00106A3260|nr:CaiB/BaiF CoA-transferase family protein [Cryobacterium sp. TMS1-20-1]TFC73585.1 CoA transferase [Cryobacterium sp. TMS1-20-1]
MSQTLPLEGITVISCEHAVAAPLATRHLADQGARVIKIERPGTGDFARGYDETVNGLSSHFVWLNRNKESLALDLKRPEALAIMHELLATADVFVQNLAPDAAARLGLGAAELRERYPTLITCSISGYGSSGPYRDAKAYDLLIQSEAGLVAITGTAEAPAKTGIPTADIGAGMYALSGILTALFHRERTGEGSEVEVSLFDSVVEWMGFPLYYTEYGGTAPARAGTSHASIAPYGTFRAGDGVDVVLSVQNDREWASFCAGVLERPDLINDERFATSSVRLTHRTELHAVVDAVFASHDGPEMERRLAESTVAFARQREVKDVLTHPQLSARNRWRTVETSAGQVRALLPAVTVVGQAVRMDRVPDVGADTRSILGALGYSAAAIDELTGAGVL